MRSNEILEVMRRLGIRVEKGKLYLVAKDVKEYLKIYENRKKNYYK